jgi:ParB-like chromosome segregation protein Spo0J
METVNIGDLNPAKYNPRKISKEALEGLKSSIVRFGLKGSVIANKRNNNVVGGHQRLKCLIELGVNQVPVDWVDLNDVDEKALNIALNSRHISGEFDADILIPLLEDLRIELPEFEALRFDELELEFDIDQEMEAPFDESKSSNQGTGKCQLIIDCAGEAEQEIVYNQLTGLGINSQIVNK